MANQFEIRESRKVGLNSKEGYIVVRDRISYLRVLGAEPEWELMTATASEDTGEILVCRESRRLVEAALRFGAELGTSPRVEKDWMGREYVKICVIRTHPDDDVAEVRKEIDKALTGYFEFYDAYEPPEARPHNDMQELYEALAIDDVGSDVYLSDGVWLSSDGSLHDRGR